MCYSAPTSGSERPRAGSRASRSTRPHHRRRGRDRSWRVPGAVLGLAALLVGCEVFDPRDPEFTEPPDIPAECQARDAINRIDALVNFEQSFACAGQGTQLFEQALTPDFVFVAIPGDTQVEELVNGWQNLDPPRQGPVDLFRQHVTGITLADGTVFTIDAEATDVTQEGDLWVYRNRDYCLEFREPGGQARRFSGQATIGVRQEGSTWAIARWEDGDLEGIDTLGQFWLNGTNGGSVGSPNCDPRPAGG